MPYAVYKLVHFLGIFTLLTAMAATCMHVMRGGTRANNPHRRALGIAHGVAAFLILLGGWMDHRKTCDLDSRERGDRGALSTSGRRGRGHGDIARARSDRRRYRALQAILK